MSLQYVWLLFFFSGQCHIEVAHQAVTIMVFAWISDKYQQRAAIIAIQTVVTIVGLLLTGFATSPGWRYAGESLMKSVLAPLLMRFFRHFSRQRRVWRLHSGYHRICKVPNKPARELDFDSQVHSRQTTSSPKPRGLRPQR